MSYELNLRSRWTGPTQRSAVEEGWFTPNGRVEYAALIRHTRHSACQVALGSMLWKWKIKYSLMLVPSYGTTQLSLAALISTLSVASNCVYSLNSAASSATRVPILYFMSLSPLISTCNRASETSLQG